MFNFVDRNMVPEVPYKENLPVSIAKVTWKLYEYMIKMRKLLMGFLYKGLMLFINLNTKKIAKTEKSINMYYFQIFILS